MVYTVVLSILLYRLLFIINRKLTENEMEATTVAMAKKIRKFFHRLGENRTLLLGVVFLAMFAVLIGRLFILQVVHGEEYADNFELQITKPEHLRVQEEIFMTGTEN